MKSVDFFVMEKNKRYGGRVLALFVMLAVICSALNTTVSMAAPNRIFLTGGVATTTSQPIYVGFYDGFFDGTDNGRQFVDSATRKVGKIYVNTFERYSGAATREARLEGAEVAYCLNAGVHIPSSDSKGRYRTRLNANTYVSYNRNTNPSTDDLYSASDYKVPQLLLDNIGIEQARIELTPEQLKKKITSICLIGYPYDRADLKGNASDDDFRLATQYAIYKYTDPTIYDMRMNGVQSSNLGEGLQGKADLTSTQRGLIEKIVNQANLSDDVLEPASTVLNLYTLVAHVESYTEGDKTKWYNIVEESQNLISLGNFGDTTIPTSTTTATIRAEKKVNGTAPGQDQVFNFSLTDANGVVIQTVQNVNDRVEFSPIQYNAEGVYAYTLEEVKGNAAGYTYDDRKYTVVVTVVKDENTGKLKSEVKYYDRTLPELGEVDYYGYTTKPNLIDYTTEDKLKRIYVVPKKVLEAGISSGIYNWDMGSDEFKDSQVKTLVKNSKVVYCLESGKAAPTMIGSTSLFDYDNDFNRITKIDLELYKKSYLGSYYDLLNAIYKGTRANNEFYAYGIKNVLAGGYENDIYSLMTVIDGNKARALTQHGVYYFANTLSNATLNDKYNTTDKEIYKKLVNREKPNDKNIRLILDTIVFYELYTVQGTESVQNLIRACINSANAVAVFDNKQSTTTTLTLEKTVTGNIGDREQFFQFSLTASEKVPRAYITYSNPDQDHVNGERDLGDVPDIITLKHGQSATISNLPPTVTITVTEYISNDENYTVETKVGDTGEFAENAEKRVVVDMNTNQTVKFRNMRNFEHVNTGVTTDIIPFAICVLLAIAGLVAFSVRRRAGRTQ